MFSEPTVRGGSSSEEDEPRTSSNGHHDERTCHKDCMSRKLRRLEGLTRSYVTFKTITFPRRAQPARFDITYILNRQFIIKPLACRFTTFIDWNE